MSSREPQEHIYVTVEEAIALHAEIVGAPGAASADLVRHWNLLESALVCPRNAALYEDATIPRQAATLLWGILKNHPFVDGLPR